MGDEKKKVLVALSGGVDSATTAALLKEQGYAVTGVTMEVCPQEASLLPESGCGSLRAVADARRVAEILGIPFYVMNFRQLFKDEVINYFIREYARGRTPNPCIACNRKIKFDALLRKTRALGFDFLATGHYARISFNQDCNRYLLQKARDPDKDQSYVLYGLTQEQMKHILLPLGYYRKGEVRRLAAARHLPVAAKADSQEICFITDHDYRKFLKERLGDQVKPGFILNEAEQVVGRHRGIPFYTVGQRKGLGLAAGHPLYVTAIDYTRNTITVGTKQQAHSKGLVARDNNYILFDQLVAPREIMAKIRYKANEVPALMAPQPDGKTEIIFQEPQWAVTPGQAVVYYQGDLVVGGGTIERAV